MNKDGQQNIGNFQKMSQGPDSLATLLSVQPLLITDVMGDVGVFFSGVKNNLCIIHNVPLNCARLSF